MTNIVFIIRSLNYGGAERQLVNLVKGLNREKFNPTVLHFYPGPLAKELVDANVPVISLEKKGPWELFGFLSRLYKVLKNLKPDVIHGYDSLPNILPMMFKPFFPKTRLVFGVRASNMDLDRYQLKCKIFFKMECFFSRFADLIIVNSRAGFDYVISKGFHKEKMIVIPNGIDTDRFKPDKSTGLSLRKEWGVCDGETLIGQVGRLDPMKDHPTFLKAASLLLKGKKNVRFVCLGTGDRAYKDKLVTLAQELGLSDRIHWAGPTNDMPAVYNALDIVTSSSSFGEGFPNIIGEAMACKIPCVVTDVGDSSLVMGETGIVIPPKNPESMAKGWIESMNEDKDETTSKARFRIEKNFSLQKLFQRTEEALSLNGKLPVMDQSLDI